MNELTNEEINKEIEKFKKEIENLKKELCRKTGFEVDLTLSIYNLGDAFMCVGNTAGYKSRMQIKI
mgnify:CR=1 FL=1